MVPQHQDSGKQMNVLPALTNTNDTRKKNPYSELLEFFLLIKAGGKKKKQKEETHH